MFLLISNHDNENVENLTNNRSETKTLTRPKNILMLIEYRININFIYTRGPEKLNK